jgi:hypothetical protein
MRHSNIKAYQQHIEFAIFGQLFIIMTSFVGDSLGLG